MPENIYKNLWETITAGKSWNGRIKNLKKNKDAYWINVHIEPIFNNNTIIAYQAVRQNITNERLYQKLAKTDYLTGHYNRTSIEEFAELFIDEATRYKNFFSIIMIDLDDFKEVNDSFGHQAGDLVLKKVAEIATTLIRSSDRIGRFGGEEFIVLLPQTPYEQAKDFAERLRIGISIYHFDGVGAKTASFGVATLEEDDTFFSLIEKADKALYRAKEMGKDQVC
jgi:diguanylate cyclase (GGDEF)-like protein